MASTYRIAESASESLYEDERLRSSLTDAEGEIVLRWACDWLTEQVNAAPDEASAQRIAQDSGARVRASISALNKLFRKPANITLAAAVNAIEPTLTQGKPFSREEVLLLVTGLAPAAWKLR